MASRVAAKSNMIHRHGCLIVAQNKIVCTGYNRYTHNNHNSFSIHAEIDALQKAKKASVLLKSKPCVMYVVRIGGSECLKNSKPCSMCAQWIAESGISKVFYSTTHID